MRCPSDDHPHDDPEWQASNYAGSMGPTCTGEYCTFSFRQYCNLPGIPESPGFGDGDPGTGLFFGNVGPNSPGHDPRNIRGCFNRLGARITLQMIKDGASQTIMVGEVRAQENILTWYPLLRDGNLTGHWSATNAYYAWGSTLPPINYRTDVKRPCSTAFGVLVGESDPGNDPEAIQHSWHNWDVACGFKSRHPGGANFLFADGSVHFLPEDLDHILYQYMGAREDRTPIEIP